MSSLQSKVIALLTVVTLLALTILTISCTDTKTALVEKAPAYQSTTNEATVKMANPVAPKIGEVRTAVHRVFKNAVVVESIATPNFFIGDFNGDGSQDLVVILRPAIGKLAELNEEYPAWLLRDPFVVAQNANAGLRIQQEDILLAIIHGYGADDWRDPQATQTFLLKNSVGSNITIKTGRDFALEYSGKRLPRPQGDLIFENVRGTNGYLYYANSGYQWHDPETYQPSAEIGMGHNRSKRIRN